MILSQSGQRRSVLRIKLYFSLKWFKIHTLWSIFISQVKERECVFGVPSKLMKQEKCLSQNFPIGKKISTLMLIPCCLLLFLRWSFSNV